MQLFAVLHRGPNGEGSGTTIVVARNERQARTLVKAYLDAKPNGAGVAQCSSASLLEVLDYDDSTFASFPMPAESLGVKVEYVFHPDCHEPDVVFVEGLEQFIGELDAAQARQNEGRGVSCVNDACFYMRQGRVGAARSFLITDSDKVYQYPDIVALLKRVGFWYEWRMR